MQAGVGLTARSARGERRDPPSVSIGREETMEKTTLTRRAVLRTATLATTALATLKA